MAMGERLCLTKEEPNVSRNFRMRKELRTIVRVNVDVHKRFLARASVKEAVTATEIVGVTDRRQ